MSVKSALAEEFLAYCEVELRFSPQTIIKYRDCLRQVCRFLDGRAPETLSKADLLAFKQTLIARGLGINRQTTILLALKRFLRYLSEECGRDSLPAEAVKVPRRPRRDVPYLSSDEVAQFVSAIKTESKSGIPYVPGLRFRALVEALLGSAMRIGEALSLNRQDVNFATAEASVVGKGAKQRTVFFSARAVTWIARYLSTRNDAHPALFVTHDGKERLKQADVWRPFVRTRQAAGIQKRITPHMLRHTAATQLLFNGCPISHIKEILGHERLETTCRYYLGLDRRAAKAALHKFLVYSGDDLAKSA